MVSHEPVTLEHSRQITYFDGNVMNKLFLSITWLCAATGRHDRQLIVSFAETHYHRSAMLVTSHELNRPAQASGGQPSSI